MAEFIGGIVTVLTTLFSGLLQVLGGVGGLVFDLGEAGITGLTPFGWLTVALVGIPLTTWLFSKAIGLFKMIFKK